MRRAECWARHSSAGVFEPRFDQAGRGTEANSESVNQRGSCRRNASGPCTSTTPERRASAGHDVELEWRQADAEAQPFADGEFDTVLSCVGIMFAPHHQAAADEMLRVCRPGGTIGLLNWTPEGFIGQMFATMKPYASLPPPGTQPPPLWGRPEYVRALFGDQVTDVTADRRTVQIDRFTTPEAFRDYFKSNYGPTVAAYRAIANDPDRVTALDHDLATLAHRHTHDTGTTSMAWEYLLLTARKTEG
ncbi:class I SAM-dependent methyltransferase [Streptosporangium sp. NPDC005286]|uniref:class I SAM-dependent methyltransferase n=1 Tax=Streptosporangium sp. NPDC005286 TaxID=3154463 RepID=UPI0033AA1CAF